MAFGAYCFGVRDSGDLILQGLGSLKLLMVLVELVRVGRWLQGYSSAASCLESKLN